MRWTNAFLDELRTESDPEVDGMVGTFLQERGKPARDLLAPMIRYESLPPEDRSEEITEWLADRPDLPEWADSTLMKRGVEFFEENGPQIMTCLLFASLPECYAARKGVHVLHITSELLSHTKRRLVETARLVVLSPGGLEPGGVGYNTTRRVRLMHSGIRWEIVSDERIVKTGDPNEMRPHYDPAWGVPINQEDLLGTLMTFSIVILDALRKTGERFDDEDAAAYQHTWNVVGHLIGIRPDLLPIDLEEGRELMDLIRRRQHAPCRQGQELNDAILSFAQGAIGDARWLYGLPASLMRYMIGDRVADILAVPQADYTKYWIPALVQFRRFVELFGQQRIMRLITADFNRNLLRQMLAAQRGVDRGGFTLRDELMEKWDLRPVALPV